MSARPETPSHAAVESGDSDFCVARLDRGELTRLQAQAEAAEWAARWASAAALTRQVGPGPIYLRPFIREHRGDAGAVLAYRCLVLFRDARDPRRPCASTLDVGATDLHSLKRIELRTEAGGAVVDLFSLVLFAVDVTPHASD